MRVLFLTSTFHPKIGGAETYALNITRGLASCGHTVEIVSDAIEGEPAAVAWTQGVTLRRLHNYRTRFNSPGTIYWEEMAFGLRPEIETIIRQFEPEIVFSNSLDLCVMAKLTSVSSGAPWIATFHEQAPERDPMGVATLRTFYGLLQPDAIVAGSLFYLNRAKAFALNSRCHLIYHGIDTDKFCPLDTAAEVRRHYAVPIDATLIVSLGRFKSRKGFLDLIRAFGSHRQEGRHTVLVIAGSLNSASAEYLEEMEALIRTLGISGSVCIERDLHQERVPWLLSGADLVVQASWEEGLGLALIEAMACGRAIVATRIPGHVEVVDNSLAVLVEPRATTELASAIAALTDDPPRRHALGIQARRRAIERFSLCAMAAATTKVMDEVVASGSSIAR